MTKMAKTDFINKVVRDITHTTLNEIISHSQIILHDLNEGLITAETFEKYQEQQPECGYFLLTVVGQNVTQALKMLCSEKCHYEDCEEERAAKVTPKKRVRKKAKLSVADDN